MAIHRGLATAVDMAVTTPLRATADRARVTAAVHVPAVAATIVRRAVVVGTPTVAAEAAIPAEVVADIQVEVVVDTPVVADIVAIADGKETA